MKRALLSSVLLGALLFTGVTVAKQVPGRGKFTVYGHGTRSCGGWLEERRKPNPGIGLVANRAWVAGFVSGFGYVGQKMKETDSDGIEVFIDTYCAAHPLSLISEAAIALVEELTVKNP